MPARRTVAVVALTLLAAASWAKEPAAAEWYRLGKLQYDRGQHDEALRNFDQIVSRYPQDPLAEYAANLSLDILNLKGDYEALLKLARRYAADPALMRHRTLSETLEKILPQIAMKQAEQLASKGEYPAAARAYLEVAAEYPNWTAVDSALYNAAICFEKAGNRDQALVSYRRLVDDFGKSPLARLAKESLSRLKPE